MNETAGKIAEIINDYCKNSVVLLEKRIDECADEILSYIKQNAPKGESSRHLADSFIKTVIGEGNDTVIYISSSSKGRIVHLIELGYRHTSGKHVAARPFLRPAYDIFSPKMLEDLKRIIVNGAT
ncbi:hypothetical protein GX831_01605 [bacterium]|nr:hypothetical protein [bacterium]